MNKTVRKNTTAKDPSRHSQPSHPARARSRRVGPSETQKAELTPRRRGNRTVAPKQPREGQPEGHVGRK